MFLESFLRFGIKIKRSRRVTTVLGRGFHFRREWVMLLKYLQELQCLKHQNLRTNWFEKKEMFLFTYMHKHNIFNENSGIKQESRIKFKWLNNIPTHFKYPLSGDFTVTQRSNKGAHLKFQYNYQYFRF